MGRSGQIRAKYDYLIREFLQDARYDVREDGTIWTRILMNGRESPDVWRKAGKYSGEGYIQIRYQGVYLQAHRIVYQKFVATLQADLIVDHRDSKRDNNKPDNLRLATVRSNRLYIEQRKERENAALQSASPKEGQTTGSPELLEGSARPEDEVDNVPF